MRLGSILHPPSGKRRCGCRCICHSSASCVRGPATNTHETCLTRQPRHVCHVSVCSVTTQCSVHRRQGVHIPHTWRNVADEFSVEPSPHTSRTWPDGGSVNVHYSLAGRRYRTAPRPGPARCALALPVAVHSSLYTAQPFNNGALTDTRNTATPYVLSYTVQTTVYTTRHVQPTKYSTLYSRRVGSRGCDQGVRIHIRYGLYTCIMLLLACSLLLFMCLLVL